MGKTLRNMVDAEGNTLKFAEGTLIRPPVSMEEKQKSFLKTTFYKLLTDKEAREEYVTGIRVKMIELFYRAPKVI
ncbi:hypothetical protein A3K73_06630 [Candidatus Pacearchaeota archaeon RBG_13_36_9]|nr:MAG: hypothetical protein A3K73_06630 [Candidatus Pacearchaeota archaeon RBG_13_36_9]